MLNIVLVYQGDPQCQAEPCWPHNDSPVGVGVARAEGGASVTDAGVASAEGAGAGAQVLARLPALVQLDGRAVTAGERAAAAESLRREAVVLALLASSAGLCHKLARAPVLVIDAWLLSLTVAFAASHDLLTACARLRTPACHSRTGGLAQK